VRSKLSYLARLARAFNYDRKGGLGHHSDGSPITGQILESPCATNYVFCRRSQNHQLSH